MMKTVLFFVSKPYRFKFAPGTLNFRDPNNVHKLLKTENQYISSLIISDRSYSSQQTVLTKNNSHHNLQLPSLISAQNILRWKTTNSTATSKEESTSTKDKQPVKEIDVTPLTRSDKLKKALKEYGSTVIVFHVGISLISLGTCYLVVTSGLDVTKVFAALGLGEWADKSQLVANAGTFAVAYAIHKVFAPVRIGITLGSVPLIVRYLRKIGFLKK